MEVTLINYMVSPQMGPAVAAYICRHNTPELTPDYDILGKALEDGHTSLLEHATFTFYLYGVTRSLTHQLVRYRIASYAQTSQRHIELIDDWLHIPDNFNEEQLQDLEEFKEYVERLYWKWYKSGMKKEDARGILPNLTKTNIIMTTNARELNHFFDQRICLRAEPPIREIATSMYKQAKLVAPLLFTTNYPNCQDCKEKCH